MTDTESHAPLSASAATMIGGTPPPRRQAPRSLSPQALARAAEPTADPISPIVLACTVRMVEFGIVVLIGMLIYAVYVPTEPGALWRYLGATVSIATLATLAFQVADIYQVQAFRGYEKDSDLVNGLDKFSRRAFDIISSPRSRQAFDIARESPSITGLFNESSFAQSCLLATRLVEAGTRFVSVSSGGWDTHNDNFKALKTRLLPDLDSALSGLFLALDAKGLLETTAVFVTGEFGRTPKINPRAGRDHYPRAMFVLLGGGGMKGGQVVGASDDKAMGPASGDGISPDDVAATFYHSLGIDFQKEYRTPTGRPVAIVRYGNVLKELFA